ncbi:hypothetical protein [Nodosilinea sp. E11]|uniref:hypothetical protein n=1 Tax=Nodosilinea sp. E11 TaxID=3037479 RepID=UPI002934F754|nr:hypothetical protein [Nodosilinea sp. E11]WOD39110.1 hypothetical protein RRF56_23160 [Nodosilinea sp. E11]
MGTKIVQSTLFSSLVKSFSSQGRSSDRAPLAPLMLATAAVATLGVVSQAPAQAQVSEASAVAQTAAAPRISEAGRYLFGQNPQPDQVGQGYVVLERTGDRVYGALYYPSSSFDCFHGQVQGSEMAMTVINSYDQDAYSYSLALADGPVVATTDTLDGLDPFNLSGFHAIDTLSDNDHRMLDVCRGVVAPNL